MSLVREPADCSPHLGRFRSNRVSEIPGGGCSTGLSESQVDAKPNGLVEGGGVGHTRTLPAGQNSRGLNSSSCVRMA